MKGIWAVGVVTFLEGIRNRSLYGITIIALLLLVSNLIMSGLVPQSVGKLAVDIALSTVSFTGLLIVLFIGINLVAKDLDRKTIYMVLSRPISRQDYIVGKFSGIAALIVASVVVLGLFAALSIFITQSNFPEYFARFPSDCFFCPFVGFAFCGEFVVRLVCFQFVYNACDDSNCLYYWPFLVRREVIAFWRFADCIRIVGGCREAC